MEEMPTPRDFFMILTRCGTGNQGSSSRWTGKRRSGRVLDSRLERLDLLRRVADAGDGSKGTFGNGGTIQRGGHGQQQLLDFRANRRSINTCLTRARVMPSRRAMSAWVAATPASSWRFHSLALSRDLTTPGVRGSLGGLGASGGAHRSR